MAKGIEFAKKTKVLFNGLRFEFSKGVHAVADDLADFIIENKLGQEVVVEGSKKKGKSKEK